MAKATETTENETPTTTALVTQKADVISMFGIDALAAIQAEFGVTPSDVTIPVPAVASKLNLDQLCNLKTQIFNADGALIERVNGHSGPLMFLEKQGEYDGDKFAGYDGFYVYAIVIPGKSKTVVTIGRPVGESKPSVVVYLDGLSKGAIFQVASIATSKGFRVFNPVPVQTDGKLLVG